MRRVGPPHGLVLAPRDVGVGAAELDRLIGRQRDHFAARGEAVRRKVRGHDEPEDLAERLRARTDFALLLGGTTVAAWRGRGISRALVAARAELAAARGVRYLLVDASDDSAPILRRLGFDAVTTATSYVWSPPRP